MKIASLKTPNPHNGVARRWCIGPVNIEWYVSRPRESWLKYDASFNVRWYNGAP